MNEMTKRIQQIMYPKAALIAYECETADFSHPQNYLELRPINERGRMGAGIPVTYEFMNSLTKSLHGRHERDTTRTHPSQYAPV